MPHQEPQDVSPEEMVTLDHLARLLEQYQTYLIANYPFADSARAQAANASGTARPVLQRLYGTEAVSRFESALRILRSDADRQSILEDVESALKDLRASIATAKWRESHAGGTVSSGARPEADPSALQGVPKTQSVRAAS